MWCQFRRLVLCQLSKALAAHDQAHTRQAPMLQVPQEVRPPALVLLGALHDPKNLAVATLVDSDCHKHAHVLDLASPGPLQHDPKPWSS